MSFNITSRLPGRLVILALLRGLTVILSNDLAIVTTGRAGGQAGRGGRDGILTGSSCPGTLTVHSYVLKYAPAPVLPRSNTDI